MSEPIWRQITGAFEKWLSLPNYDVIEVVGATVMANRLPGEPLWLALVGPSSSGKTEIVRALETTKGIEQIDSFTTSTLASGYKPGKSKKGEKNGSVGEYGLLSKHMNGAPFIITINDFSMILSKRHEFRNEIMNQFRRLYDGAYDASFGNGVSLQWRGKCGVITCSTGSYDREMGAQSVFGDRFLVCRNTPGDPTQVAERAGRNSKDTEKMRLELREAFRKLDRIKLPKEEINLALDVRTLVSRLCTFIATCRTQVPRDSYRHEIQAKPELEGTGRMSAQLHQLLRGLLVFKKTAHITHDEIGVIERVAFGTIPSLRYEILNEIDPKEGSTAQELQEFTGIPRSVLHRTLEDMRLLELISWESTTKPISRKGAHFVAEKWLPFVYHLQNRPGGV